jgi:hypothetical protein
MTEADQSQVVRVRDIARDAIVGLAQRYSIDLEWLDDTAAIANSFWGEPEAGISRIGVRLRGDTPVHSLLHELCHMVCMTAQRRRQLERDAGGTAAEECGVCYLQVLLAEYLPGFGAARCLADMDSWGYSFREGTAALWFDGDGRDARGWLRVHGLIDAHARPTFQLRS